MYNVDRVSNTFLLESGCCLWHSLVTMYSLLTEAAYQINTNCIQNIIRSTQKEPNLVSTSTEGKMCTTEQALEKKYGHNSTKSATSISIIHPKRIRIALR
ncbi:hypothetical protein M758_3G062200 [Ceratodon purpureus]|uniref:Uncharacterized protein n=1 Tax=Ceratodon purpureus TaxID=3225 RepID=A0A8T0IHS9_CERPU|nr:hypothetical protein KC19_3G062700 [Ceratodon purpureus]KAG0621965.1 hypothetical protein M758_3G062200 [Ceratodon purpureus]